jgi:hypothetical protein
MVQLRTNPDGSVTEIAPTHCPNGHRLGPRRVIASWSPARGDERVALLGVRHEDLAGRVHDPGSRTALDGTSLLRLKLRYRSRELG